MALARLIAVFNGDLEESTETYKFLQGHLVPVKMIPDVTSPPLPGQAADDVRTRYSLYVLLVGEEDAEWAEGLIKAYVAGR